MFTEKFALLNLLKALESLSPKQERAEGAAEHADPVSPTRAANDLSAQKSVPEQGGAYPNFMLGVLERHEAISNRVKNKK